MGNEENADGLPRDGVSTYPASDRDMQLYRDASGALSRFQTPVLLHSASAHERLYVAAFDGTGNDKFKDPLHATNVAKIENQFEELIDSGREDIGVGYMPGPGTEDHAVRRVLDGAIGFTHEARVEAIYAQFIMKAAEWLREDPQATICLADIGFSRGAEEAASFARLVHERGIQDPRGAIYTYDSHGNITHVDYTEPPLVEPGKVAQVVGLFDPVGTGAPVNDYDRRLPPSVISGVQIFSKDEHRGLFKSDHIIDPGVTPDGRFLGVLVPGAHSDVGGGYLRNGLSIRSGNLMVDYLNALSDHPLLQKSPEPTDPRLNVVHRSTEGLLLYRVWDKVDRLEPEGYNTLEAPRHRHHGYRVAGDPYNAEPRDEALSGRFDFRAVAISPVPGAGREAVQESAKTPATDPVDAMVERLYQAALTQDDRAMDAVAGDYLLSPQGTAWWREIQQYSQAMQVPEPALAYQGQPPEPAMANAMQR
ncbi:phospholipase effector Tle1 domain-containing protein [Frateuria sp. GZRR33]|uniref:phospholipase effector Tle1 domain-containing protein n=1 Tax=Frateuria sp. GZRR33 TaxID=3351535 RepID=UPI003EDBD2D0